MTGLLLATPRYLEALTADVDDAPELRPLPSVAGACPEEQRGYLLTAPLELVVQASSWRRWQARRRAC